MSKLPSSKRREKVNKFEKVITFLCPRASGKKAGVISSVKVRKASIRSTKMIIPARAPIPSEYREWSLGSNLVSNRGELSITLPPGRRKKPAVIDGIAISGWSSPSVARAGVKTELGINRTKTGESKYKNNVRHSSPPCSFITMSRRYRMRYETRVSG